MNKPKAKHLEQGLQGLSASAGAINPILGGVIGVAVALFGPALARKIGRAEDILQVIQEHPELFTDEVLASEQFQDGLVFFIEKYIRERNDEKLIIMRRIFAGFVKSQNLKRFPLEEMTDLVSRLRFYDVELFGKAVIQAKQQQELRIPENSRSFSFNEHPFDVSRLVYFGLLMEDRTRNGAQIREANDPGFLYIWVSPLGDEFSKFLNDTTIN